MSARGVYNFGMRRRVIPDLADAQTSPGIGKRIHSTPHPVPHLLPPPFSASLLPLLVLVFSRIGVLILTKLHTTLPGRCMP